MRVDRPGRVAVLWSVLLASASWAMAEGRDGGRVESIGSLPVGGVSSEGLSSAGWRIVRPNGDLAGELWLAPALDKLEDGSFVGVVRLATEGRDVRGRSVAPGFYSLRFATIPPGDRHGRCLQRPDFVLLLPAVDDAERGARLSYSEMTTLSSTLALGRHPVVWQAERARAQGPNARFVVETNGDEVLTLPLGPSGESRALRIVLRSGPAR